MDINLENLALNLLSQSAFLQVNKELLYYIRDAESTLLFTELLTEFKYLRDRNQLTSDGYFFCTISFMEERTTMNRHAQTSCIKKLITLGLLYVVIRGSPGKRHFKVKLDKVMEILSAQKVKPDKNNAYEYYTALNDSLHRDTFSNFLYSTDKMGKELAFTLYFWARYIKKKNPECIWIWKPETVGVVSMYVQNKLRTGVIDYSYMVKYLQEHEVRQKDTLMVKDFFMKQKEISDIAPNKRLTDYTNLLQMIE